MGVTWVPTEKEGGQNDQHWLMPFGVHASRNTAMTVTAFAKTSD